MTDETITDAQFREAARRLYEREGEIEIDEPSTDDGGTHVSRNDSPKSCDGAYMKAWVWVENDQVVTMLRGASPHRAPRT